MSSRRDEFKESARRADEAVRAVEAVNAKAQAQGRQHHDNADAARVQQLRELGRAIGQPKVYERRIKKFLKSRGYK